MMLLEDISTVHKYALKTQFVLQCISNNTILIRIKFITVVFLKL